VLKLIAGGTVSIVAGPDAGAKVAEFFWRDHGFNQ
jgi:hypothetical protein